MYNIIFRYRLCKSVPRTMLVTAVGRHEVLHVLTELGTLPVPIPKLSRSRRLDCTAVPRTKCKSSYRKRTRQTGAERPHAPNISSTVVPRYILLENIGRISTVRIPG